MSSSSPLAKRLLEDFLPLADAHGSFCEALVVLAALCRGDLPGSRPPCARSAGCSLPRLAAAARAVACKAPAALKEDLRPGTAALVAAVSDPTVAVASASTAIFSGVSALSNATAAARVEVASTPLLDLHPFA